METMGYNYYAPPAPHHQFQYSNFGADTPLAGQGAFQSDLTSPVQSMELPIDGNNFFNYPTYEPALGAAPGLAPLPAGSASPPAHQSMSIISNSSADSAIGLDMDNELFHRRSSSEEKESLTPAQSRRKAQNRAAQRAFRERKERHVRDLEAKLNHLTTTTSSLQSDNERLKLMLQRVQTENEILRASCRSSPPRSSHQFVDEPSLMPGHSMPQQIPQPHNDGLYDPLRLSSGLDSSPSNYGSLTSNIDSHLLSAGAAWDLLQSHPLYMSGSMDMGKVCDRMKKIARCDSMGPVFEERDVLRLIDEAQSGL